MDIEACCVSCVAGIFAGVPRGGFINATCNAEQFGQYAEGMWKKILVNEAFELPSAVVSVAFQPIACPWLVSFHRYHCIAVSSAYLVHLYILDGHPTIACLYP